MFETISVALTRASQPHTPHARARIGKEARAPMDDDESDNESLPPPANGHAVPAAAAQGAANGNGAAAQAPPPQPPPQPQPPAPQHPLWERAAGRGGGGTAPKGNPGQITSQGRFGPISMSALEQRARHEFDGASSVGARTAHERSKADKPRRARGEDDDNEDDDNSGEPRRRKKRRSGVHDYDDLEDADDEDDNRSDAASGVDVCAGAAFGGGDGRRNTCRSLSIASDTDDGVSSVTSSRAREAHRRAFPISGETCVGCALPAKVGPVDDFVRTHCDKMKEDALFKMAALVYQQQVVEPAEAEDVPVPLWPWKDIRAHYTMHRMDPKMQRYENMRTLAAMRKTIELSLQKEEQDEEGNRVFTLDKGNAEQIMKVITLQSREITLLHDTHSTPKAASAKK